MRVAESNVFWVSIHTAKRKGKLYLVERYAGHYYKTRTVAGPLRQDELPQAIADRQAHWNTVGKVMLHEVLKSYEAPR